MYLFPLINIAFSLILQIFEHFADHEENSGSLPLRLFEPCLPSALAYRLVCLRFMVAAALRANYRTAL